LAGGRILESLAALNVFQVRASTVMADKDDILLNSREVAFLLDLSPDTVNEFARRNILPAFKKGRQWRFRRRDIISAKRQLSRGVNAAA
jgi:excisionase family DNA binding protein